MKTRLNKLLTTLGAMAITISLVSCANLVLAQDYYQATGIPVQRSAMSSAEFRTEFSSIETDISDKLPAYTGNADEFIVVNAGATALTSKTAAEANIAVTDATATISAVWTFSTDPVMSGIDTATSSEAAIGITADGSVDLYHNNILRFLTMAQGGVEIRSDTSTDTEIRQLLFRHQDGTTRATIGHLNNDDFVVKNRIHGGLIYMQAERAAGTDVNVFAANPDGDTVVYAAGATPSKVSLWAGGDGATGGAEVLRAEDKDALGATETALWLYDNDNGALQQVTVGPASSCGVGYKCLRIVN